MSVRNPFKKVVRRLNISLDEIEKDINELSITTTSDLVIVISSIFSKRLNRNKNAKELSDKLDIYKEIDARIDKVLASIESARETYKIPYKDTKIEDFKEKAIEVEEIARELYSLLARARKAQSNLHKIVGNEIDSVFEENPTLNF